MSTPLVVGLSPRNERIIRRLSTVTVLTLAIAAGILSFNGTRQIALVSGISPKLAWIFAILLDGMVVTGSLGVILSSLVGMSSWYSWLLTTIGVVASIATNVASSPHDFTARLVHSAPPAIFALSIEGLLRIYRTSAVASSQREIARLAKDEVDYEKQLKSEERADRKRERERERELQNSKQLSIIPTYIQNPQSINPIQGKESPLLNIAPRNYNNIQVKPVGSRGRILEYLKNNPESKDMPAGEISRILTTDPSLTRKTVREYRLLNEPSEENLKIVSSTHEEETLTPDTEKIFEKSTLAITPDGISSFFDKHIEAIEPMPNIAQE